MLDRSNISIDLQWAYLENGSRIFQYGFGSGGSVPRPSVYRQPRTPGSGSAVKQ